MSGTLQPIPKSECYVQDFKHYTTRYLLTHTLLYDWYDVKL